MIIVWTRQASASRDEIIWHIAGDNPAAAHRLDALISRKAGLLADHPRLGRPGRRSGTRELVLHPSYVLVYEVRDTTVRILRIIHTARAWPPRRP